MSDVRPVPFAPGYFVSDDGRVFSEMRGTRRALKPRIYHGYEHVTLCTGGGQHILTKVHRIVARTFLGEGCPGMEVRHLDGTRTNNCVSNLAWGTRRDNALDRERHGRNPQHLYPERRPRGNRHGAKTSPQSIARGSRCGRAKLTEANVACIRARLADGATHASLAKEFGVVEQNIGCIARNETWKHVVLTDASCADGMRPFGGERITYGEK